jgi:hypothetical protein
MMISSPGFDYRLKFNAADLSTGLKILSLDQRGSRHGLTEEVVHDFLGIE